MKSKWEIVGKLLNFFLIIGVFVIVALQGRVTFSSTGTVAQPSHPMMITEEIKNVFPAAVSASVIDTNWIAIWDATQAPIGYIIYTSPYTDHIYGFSGATPLMIALDEKRVIIGTFLLENTETESYVRRLLKSGFFDSWNGLTLEEAVSKEVDAISGATRTSEAVIKTFHKRVGDISQIHSPQRTNLWRIVKELAALVVIGLAIYCFLRPQQGKKIRIYVLGLSVIILGFWDGLFLSLAGIHGWLVSGADIQTQYILILLFLLSVLFPLFTGKRFYCTWVCPYGSAQEIMGKLNKKKIKLPSKLAGILFQMRKYILLLIIFLLLVGMISDLSLTEPFSAFMIRSAADFVLILAGTFLVLSVFFTKPWCNYFCPTGQLLDAFKNVSFHRKNQKNEK